MLGVAIIAMDSPQYLARLLASLRAQEYEGEVDYHLWQDGITNEYSGRVVADEWHWNATRYIWDKCGLPNKYAHVNIANKGVGLHQLGAIEWMLCDYDRLMVVEDDVVLSPHWLRLLDVLFEQFAEHPEVFGFCPGFKHQGTNEAGLLWQDEHWWCEAFTVDAWRKVRIHYADYIRIIRDVDYKDRDHDAIRALFKRHGFTNPSTSQDAGKDWAIHRAGMRRVCCEVNRAMGIGKTGIHFTPRMFAEAGYNHCIPYAHEGDATRTRFDDPINA